MDVLSVILVENILKELNINFETQFSIKNISFQNYIKVDFKIQTLDNKLLFIEYNGIQHYKPIEYFGGEERFYNY